MHHHVEYGGALVANELANEMTRQKNELPNKHLKLFRA